MTIKTDAREPSPRCLSLSCPALVMSTALRKESFVYFVFHRNFTTMTSLCVEVLMVAVPSRYPGDCHIVKWTETREHLCKLNGVIKEYSGPQNHVYLGFGRRLPCPLLQGLLPLLHPPISSMSHQDFWPEPHWMPFETWQYSIKMVVRAEDRCGGWDGIGGRILHTNHHLQI